MEWTEEHDDDTSSLPWLLYYAWRGPGQHLGGGCLVSMGSTRTGMGWGTDVYKLRPSSKLGPDNRHINQGAMDRSWVSFNFLMSQIQCRQLVPLDDLWKSYR